MSRAIMPAHSDATERYTPGWIGDGLRVLFDLDPCAPDIEYPMAKWCRKSYSLARGENGLELPWPKEASIWLNPPWQKGEKRKWVGRLHAHGCGIALVRGGVDSKWLHDHPPAALFLFRRRVGYVLPSGEAETPRVRNAVGGFEPSMLLAYGEAAAAALQACTLEGMFLRRRERL